MDVQVGLNGVVASAFPLRLALTRLCDGDEILNMDRLFLAVERDEDVNEFKYGLHPRWQFCRYPGFYEFPCSSFVPIPRLVGIEVLDWHFLVE